MFRRVSATSLVIVSLAAATWASAAKTTPQASPAASAQILMFDLAPGGSYQVRRNNVVNATPVAGPAGILEYQTNLNSGDRFEFLLTGVDPVSPSRPTVFAAVGNNAGCVSVSWTPPASSDYVTDYSLLWGKMTGAYTDSVTIDAADLSRGVKWSATWCGFTGGTYMFAIRAHNAFDRWSVLSAAAAATIGNEDTQSPVPPTNVKVVEPAPGCAAITWSKSSDLQVLGYRVYFGKKSRTQAAYSDSLDAGNAAQAQRCGLVQGSYYFAVRSYAAGGVTSAFSKEVLLVATGADVSPPTISQRYPAANASSVPLNAAIFFVLDDAGAGVDVASIAVTIDGQSQSVTTRSTGSGFAVECNPAGDFPPNSDVQVNVSVADRASPPNLAAINYPFHTGTLPLADTEAPFLTTVSPSPDAQGVDPRPVIDVRLRDGGLGVALASIVIDVNGTGVSYTFTGNPGDARIRYQPPSDFPSGSTVRVRVEACDHASPSNCATVLDYEFAVATRSAMLSGAGAIVPDGYWANDPARPLEIRNLPVRWCVRIFDAAGTAVRRHENGSDGATWSWNFHNDQGQRVAPALYLVRVTDGNGTVQRSGRFLVQSRQ